jgi:glycerophosphoryl diester phosphodiesterase
MIKTPQPWLPQSHLGWIASLLLVIATSLNVSAQENARIPVGLRGPRHGGIYVVAHRGVHNSIPENTLAAYQAAIDLGCDFVEIDVRTTRDSQLVSIHDSIVDRYTRNGETGRVAEMTLEQLRAIDIGSRVDSKWSQEKIPTVREILTLCRGKIGIYLDVKAANLSELAALVREFEMEQDTLWYIPSSRVKELTECAPRAWPMPDPGPESGLAKLLADCKPAVVASMWKYFSPTFSERCHNNGAIVIVDEDGKECWQSLLDYKADGIQTDHPAELIEFLKQRVTTQ